MEPSEVKKYLGKEVILNDPLHKLENIPCILRAYRLAAVNGKICKQAEVELIQCGRCVLYTQLEHVYPKEA